MPFFSIIIPVYNSYKYLNKCISSILNQSFADFEIIIIDDESTDESKSLCLSFAKGDSRVIFLEQNNSGPGSARNKGMSLANGDYIVFVDSDDYVEENYLKTLYDNLSDLPDVAFVGYIMENESGEVFRKQIPLLSNKPTLNFEHLIFDLISNDNFGYSWCKVVRKKFIQKNNICFNVQYFMHEDLVFICECLKHTKNIITINTCSYHYIKRSNSLCSTFHGDFIDNVEKVNACFFELLEKEKIVNWKEIILQRAVFSMYLVFKNYSLASKKMLTKKMISSFLNGPTIKRISLYKKMYFKTIRGKKRMIFYIIAIQKCIILFRIVVLFYKIKKAHS